MLVLFGFWLSNLDQNPVSCFRMNFKGPANGGKMGTRSHLQLSLLSWALFSTSIKKSHLHQSFENLKSISMNQLRKLISNKSKPGFFPGCPVTDPIPLMQSQTKSCLDYLLPAPLPSTHAPGTPLARPLVPCELAAHRRRLGLLYSFEIVT